MLEFREIDYHQDIPDAVNLIRKELDSQYTENFFRWKHINNPFGQSYGLLATDNNKIIGLRMFMFWKFYNKNRIVTALRPVDTVVDKNYRGKGLFKKLTLQGLEENKGNYDIIFNTPNENSLPGYLKMGWAKIPANEFKLGLFDFLSFNKKTQSIEFNQISKLNSDSSFFETYKCEAFLKWRYSDSRYKIARLNSATIIYSLSKIGFLKQIIIQELIGDIIDIKALVKTLCKEYRTVFVYYYVNDQTKKLSPFYQRKQKQAIIVAREDIQSIAGNINFSLGDLEGKL